VHVSPLPSISLCCSISSKRWLQKCVFASRSPKCPIEDTIYGYYPNLPTNAFFAGFFAIALGLTIWLGVHFRTRTYMVAMTLACVALGFGYAGRTDLYFYLFLGTSFLIQVIRLVIAPAFNSAAIYLTLKHIVLTFGPEWSKLKPKRCTHIS
jgi:RTA1 like protein